MSTGKRIWKQGLMDIGIVTAQQAKDWGFSGVMLEGSNASNQRAKYNNITLLQQSRRDKYCGRDVKKKQRQKTKNAQRSRRDEGDGRDAKSLNAKLQRDTTNLLIARLPTHHPSRRDQKQTRPKGNATKSSTYQRRRTDPTKSAPTTSYGPSRRDGPYGRDASPVQQQL
ncbi:hypothetical protein L2E82_15769 [Cichorium intybus]|uniref:Uncharacterized protein n=1 Tax=Cichorium intybus TaxID=13427 RepID=A0ACB9F3P3_CICIN|nr:hypothetical protein L2E82_15769 [Cichorium intybus]